MRKRGEITVFLSLILVCILSLLMGLLESARTAGARLYLNMAANSAMSSLAGHYNRNLWEMYHLLFLEYESEDAIRQTFEEYLDFYLEQKNLYPMRRQKTEISRLVTMDQEGGKALENSILSYIKYRIPDIAGDIAGVTGMVSEASKAGNFRTLFQVCKKAGKRTRKLERIRAQAEETLEDMKELLDEAVCDAEQENGGALEKTTEKLIKKGRAFVKLAEQFKKEAAALSADNEDINLEGTQDMDEKAAETMKLEEAACRSVEEMARETVARYEKITDILETDVEYLENVLEALGEGDRENEDRENENSEDEEQSEDEGGPDWELIQECIGMVKIPESEDAGEVDKEKAQALDRLEDVLSKEFLALVIPEGTKISGKRVPSNSKDASGSNEEGLPKVHDLAEQFLVNEYIKMYFDSFLGPCREREPVLDQALSYEQEYLLCGKKSDRENLSETAERLLMIRAAMNLVYLMSATDKREQANGLAMAVSGGVGPAQFVICFFILTLWALGEAVLDVRELIHGNSAEFWKDDSTWKLELDGLLSLEFLGGVSGKGDPGRVETSEANENRCEYEDYLGILLFLENKNERNIRMMNTIEWNVGKKQKDFRVKDCACEMEIRTETEQRHLFLVKTKYTQTVQTAWSY